MHEKMVDEAVLTQPMVRLMGSLTSDLPEARTEYSKTELAVCAGIGYATIHRIWPMVKHLHLVIPARKVGAVELFRANPDSKVLQSYRDLVKTLLTVELRAPMATGISKAATSEPARLRKMGSHGARVTQPTPT